MVKEYKPIPLFDVFQHLHESFNTQRPFIQSQLSTSIAINDVISDYKRSLDFLYAYRGSAETFKSYRREIERLLQWTWFIRTKSLKDLRRIDMETFLEFCKSPPKDWI